MIRTWQLCIVLVMAAALDERSLGKLFAADPTKPANVALSPQDELATFRLHDPQLTIELVAAEPDVDSPVAIAWDAAGRMYVAEMSDYPLGPEKGRIRLLEDRDQDGQYEHSHVFAKDIPFPSGLLASRGGLLVTSAPDILLLSDTDGDGIADKRQVLFTGFGEGNQQLRVNGLMWGADNWIYGANGRSDGTVRRPTDSPEKAISIAGRDFRFQPDGSVFEAVTGQSQFGVTRDNWGQRFCSWNTIALRHALVEQPLLVAYPRLAEISCRDIADPQDNTRIIPISPTPLTFNSESTEFYNALCGLAIFRGDGLGDNYVGDAFVCESLRNLVHRRKLVADGPTFVSKRAIADAEFLASTDPWCHPVYVATGPDGAMYIADFYRRFVEHPQFVADGKSRQSTDWRQGAGHGRIWRVRRRDVSTATTPRVSLEMASTTELVQNLASSNGWRRDTAQRLLVERHDANTKPQLAKAATKGQSPEARFHALCTLAGIEAIDAGLLAQAIGDPSPQVRRLAVRLSASRIDDVPKLRSAVFLAAADSDAAVRFEVAIAIGALDRQGKAAAIDRLLTAGGGTWDGIAVEIAVGRTAWSYLNRLLARQPALVNQPMPQQEQLLSNLGRMVARGRDENEIAACFEWSATNTAEQDTNRRMAVLSGLVEGLADAGVSVRQARSQPPQYLKPSLARLPSAIDHARAIAVSEQEALSHRLDALRILAHCASADEARPLGALLAARAPQPLAERAADAIVRAADEELARELFAAWKSYSVDARRTLPATALRSAVATQALVDAVEEGTIDAIEIDGTTRDALLQTRDAELLNRIKAVLAASTPADRDQVLADYASSLSMAGDSHRGAALIAQHCLICHQIQGRGRRLGPDLSGIGAHPKQELLISILDPSRNVSRDFLAYTLVTIDGQVLSGLVSSETANAVTLRRADGADETVPRDHVDVLRASGKSLMPEGLEQKLTKQDLADVLEFLIRPDAGLLDRATLPAAPNR